MHQLERGAGVDVDVDRRGRHRRRRSPSGRTRDAGACRRRAPVGGSRRSVRRGRGRTRSSGRARRRAGRAAVRRCGSREVRATAVWGRAARPSRLGVFPVAVLCADMDCSAIGRRACATRRSVIRRTTRLRTIQRGRGVSGSDRSGAGISRRGGSATTCSICRRALPMRSRQKVMSCGRPLHLGGEHVDVDVGALELAEDRPRARRVPRRNRWRPARIGGHGGGRSLRWS